MLVGGRTFGQGAHGRTMDAAERIDDMDTLFAELSSHLKRDTWTAWVIDRKKKATLVRRIQMTKPQAEAVLKAVRTATAYVAKSMDEDAAFRTELQTYAGVLDVYGDASDRFTTLRPLRVASVGDVVGLGITFHRYVLSARCETPLDRFAFDKPKDIVQFTGEVLASFARLHAGGMLHADVKLDNMIYCASERRFKLIDWGASLMFPDDVRREYMTTHRARNTTSPMAWYAFGLGSRLTRTVFMFQNGKMHPRAFLTSTDFQRIVIGAYASYRRTLDRILDGVGGDETLARGVVLERHARSFDLYSFGMVLAGIAVGSAGAQQGAIRAPLLALAERLTHYDHPEAVCDDAAAALRLWHRLLRREAASCSSR